jgi:hypothetical protein
MTGTEVERDLSRAGLWYKPIAEIVDREGYQTMNDLRAGYHDAEDVIRCGGHLLFLAWKAACSEVPLQNLAYIQESKRLWTASIADSSQAQAQAFGIRSIIRSKRMKFARKSPAGSDERSYNEARMAAAKSAVELSFSWAPKFGLAKGLGEAKDQLLGKVMIIMTNQIAMMEASVIGRATKRWEKWTDHLKEDNFDPFNPMGTTVMLKVWMFDQGARTAPLACFNELVWLKKHLKAPLCLDDVTKPVLTAPPKGEGTTTNQAVVLEPDLIAQMAYFIQCMADPAITGRRPWYACGQ